MRRINRCLNPQLLEICQNAIELEGLNALVKTYLPAHLVNYCNVGSFLRGSLTLTITNSAWATELRYAIPELRDKLRREAGLYQLVGIKITVIEENSHQLATCNKNKTIPLSNSARDTIRIASEQCNYEPLKKALQQLSTEQN
ncbi:DUF721 domain-containing protein [Legionella cardiaca]|uniref:DUF721 domain-containing protein n=1 Tax=Legionella cardiaca TaxID=1071983 RepID=A0ABY8AVT0_9GAMM|nr:DUF721 domain-containing protein [Legionella cardiaca]WED43237.1 DUF721 domain-containing protein [Legionella cardiaca]